MGWYKIILTNDQLFAGENERLQDILRNLANKGLHQKGMAIFQVSTLKKHADNNYEHINSDKIHEIYVSPVAFDVLKNEMANYKVVPIEKPIQKDLVALYWLANEAFESL